MTTGVVTPEDMEDETIMVGMTSCFSPARAILQSMNQCRHALVAASSPPSYSTNANRGVRADSPGFR